MNTVDDGMNHDDLTGGRFSPQLGHKTKISHLASRHRPFHGLIGPWLSTTIMSASATCVCTRDSPDGHHGDHPLGAGWMETSPAR